LKSAKTPKNALDRAIERAYKPRNESTDGSNVAQYYYSGSKGLDATPAAVMGPAEEASGHGPLRAFFIAGKMGGTT
jgi:hypothetical protein